MRNNQEITPLLLVFHEVPMEFRHLDVPSSWKEFVHLCEMQLSWTTFFPKVCSMNAKVKDGIRALRGVLKENMYVLHWNSKEQRVFAFLWHNILTKEVAVARFMAFPETITYWFKDVNSWQAKEETALKPAFRC